MQLGDGNIMSTDNNKCHHQNDINNFQSLGGLQVIVVDDNADSRDLIICILKDYGAQVMAAASALETLSLLEQFKPNILIIDIAMPEIDGYSLIRMIRSLNHPLNAIPAIAITAYDTLEISTLVLKFGFQSYLIKPFTPEDLVQEILKLV